MKLFVTVGTTKFLLLIEKIQSEEFQLQLLALGFKTMSIQHGTSPCEPAQTKLEIKKFNFKPSISKEIHSADLVISHMGAGTILERLRKNNSNCIGVVNTSLMDNHQQELGDALADYIWIANVKDLGCVLKQALKLNLTKKRLPTPDPKPFQVIIERILRFV